MPTPMAYSFTTPTLSRTFFTDCSAGLENGTSSAMLRRVRTVELAWKKSSAAVFTATTRTLDLRPSDPRLGVAVGTFGSYACSLRGDNLVLSQGGRVVARLRKAPSYCGEADDCAEQSLTAPACVGAWACTAARACSYACSPTSVGEGQVCGGVAGPRCIDGLSCVREGSLPEASGVCRRASNCASVRCEAGFMCRETDGQCVLVGEPCGNTHCAEGLRCCNPLRGICTRPGAYCIQ